jgi:hypothetical protein
MLHLTLDKAGHTYRANGVVTLQHVTRIMVTANKSTMQHMPTMPEVTVLDTWTPAATASSDSRAIRLHSRSADRAQRDNVQSSAMLSIRRVVPIRAAMTRRAPASTMAGGSIVSAFTTLA